MYALKNYLIDKTLFMDGYILRRTRWVKMETWDCSHPNVEKVWFTGATSLNGIPATVVLILNLLFKNGDRKEFSSESIQESADHLIVRAEEYLQSL